MHRQQRNDDLHQFVLNDLRRAIDNYHDRSDYDVVHNHVSFCDDNDRPFIGPVH